MTAFAFEETVPEPTRLSSALGDGVTKWQSAYDVGKAVKMSTAQNHVLCATNDEIDGFVKTIEIFSVNNGYSFGSVQIDGWIEAVVGPNQGATPMAVGDFVLADTQIALGTGTPVPQWTNPPGTPPSMPTGPTARVRTGSPTRKRWRVMRIKSGAGAAGSVVLLRCF
jgi:hypothetical protein